jgi:hypothetical protein
MTKLPSECSCCENEPILHFKHDTSPGKEHSTCFSCMFRHFWNFTRNNTPYELCDISEQDKFRKWQETHSYDMCQC